MGGRPYPRSVVDETGRVVDLPFPTQFGELSGRSCSFSSDRSGRGEVIRVGIDGSGLPISLRIEPNHGFTDRGVIRIGTVRRLSIGVPYHRWTVVR